MRSPFSCIIWDVDGTIVDASEGILHRLTKTLDEFGREPARREDLVHWIGPPMYDSFRARAGLDDPTATRAVARYREIAQTEGFTAGARVYPGVAELIRRLHAAGVPQGIASSKPEVQVRALMDHFELTECFDAITGATNDERTLATKSAILAEELRRLDDEGVSTTRPVLIGDRHHDVEGGAENGVPVIFVRWGFSEPREADAACAAVDDVTALTELLITPDAA